MKIKKTEKYYFYKLLVIYRMSIFKNVGSQKLLPMKIVLYVDLKYSIIDNIIYEITYNCWNRTSITNSKHVSIIDEKSKTNMKSKIQLI